MEPHIGQGSGSSRRANSSARERWNDGRECPFTADLYRAATSSDLVSESLRAHLDLCPSCRHKYTVAIRASIQVTSASARKSQLPRGKSARSPADLDSLRVPVLTRFADGDVRCLVGESVFVLFLEPRKAGWGAKCSVKCQRRAELQPIADSCSSLVTWHPSESITIVIGTESNEVKLDGEGWGDRIRFLAIDFYPGTVEQAEDLMRRYEEAAAQSPVIIEGNLNKAFERLWACIEEPLRRKLETWEGVAPVDSRIIDQAMTQTATMAYQQRNRIPQNPAEWLLKLAATNLLEILANQVGVQRQPVAQTVMIELLVDAGRHNQWAPEFVVRL